MVVSKAKKKATEETPVAEATAPAIEETAVAEAAPLENDKVKVDEIKSINEPSSDNSTNIEDLIDKEENKK